MIESAYMSNIIMIKNTPYRPFKNYFELQPQYLETEQAWFQ